MPKNEDEFVKTIDGGKSKYRNCIGYCFSFSHKGYLTENIVKQHRCLKRNCNSFCKIENSEYWKKKARKDEKRGIKLPLFYSCFANKCLQIKNNLL